MTDGEHLQDSLRILLVDDDEEEYLLVQTLLSDHSYRSSSGPAPAYRVDWVDSYEKALLEIQQKRHDVYLIDYQLGRRTGLELIREAAALELASPVILMTGHGSYDLDIKAMKVGATDYLSKSELTPPLLERSLRYAIESKRAEELIRRGAERSLLLARLSHAFGEAGLEYPEIIKESVRKISEEVGDPCFILIQRDRHFRLHHPNPKVMASAQKFIENLQKITGLPRRLWGAEPLLLNNLPQLLESYPGPLAPELEMQEFGSLLAVPLLAHSDLIGTLGCLRLRSKEPFNREELELFNSVADRASLAIENSRLYANVQQRLRELAALHTATSALLSTLDLEELLGRILDAAQSAFPAAEEGILYLTVPGTSQLQLRAVFGYKDPRIKKIINQTGFDFPARILTEKKPVLISDTEVDPAGAQNSPFRSAIAVPLIHGASIHGIIFLSASAPRVFSVNDLHLLETFAATTTAALQNALLHGEVQKLAITDSLTGFLNRRGFDDLSSREFERAVRFGRPLSAIMIDIDHFKDINDTHGHVIGDQALSLLARRLQEVLREVDVLGRYGGDEFIALLPETDPETAAAVAERIQSSFQVPLAIGKSGSQPLSLLVSASFGVAGLTSEIQDIHTLIEKADSASYRAKQSGRNRVEIA